jgi:hypothetical protein
VSVGTNQTTKQIRIAQTVAWIAMWRRYLSAIWRKRSYTRVQPCPMTRLSLAAVTISLETISD